MQLTPEQVEIETQKFEQEFPMWSISAINNLKVLESGKEIALRNRCAMLQGRLASRESNNEIDLSMPDEMVVSNQLLARCGVVILDFVKDKLELQGYTVTTQIF